MKSEYEKILEAEKEALKRENKRLETENRHLKNLIETQIRGNGSIEIQNLHSPLF